MVSKEHRTNQNPGGLSHSGVLPSQGEAFANLGSLTSYFLFICSREIYLVRRLEGNEYPWEYLVLIFMMSQLKRLDEKGAKASIFSLNPVEGQPGWSLAHNGVLCLTCHCPSTSFRQCFLLAAGTTVSLCSSHLSPLKKTTSCRNLPIISASSALGPCSNFCSPLWLCALLTCLFLRVNFGLCLSCRPPVCHSVLWLEKFPCITHLVPHQEKHIRQAF